MYATASALLLTRPMPRSLDTNRVCRVEGCGSPASEIDGFYSHRDRKVRVWVCVEHFHGDPLREVDKPEMVAEMEDLLYDWYQSARKRYTRDVAPERSESVKTLAPSGHGEAIIRSRFESWRWGEQPGDVTDPVPLPLDPRTEMILSIKRREREAAQELMYA